MPEMDEDDVACAPDAFEESVQTSNLEYSVEEEPQDKVDVQEVQQEQHVEKG